MKVVRSLEKDDNKKLDKILEMEPELTELINSNRAQKRANKIVKRVLFGIVLLSVPAYLIFQVFVSGSTLS